MKCNKCLKKIPKGEEIRFWASKLLSSKKYGGCYCENCWKNSEHYKEHEDGGKSSTSSSSNSMPWRGWLIMGIMLVVIILMSIALYFKRDD